MKTNLTQDDQDELKINGFWNLHISFCLLFFSQFLLFEGEVANV